MNAPLAMTEARQTFDWDELVQFIAERRVIPIVGKELLMLPLEGGEISLESYLAGRLAEALDLPRERLQPGCGLNEVALLHQESGGRRGRIYSKLKSLLEERPLPLPAPLRKLAAIEGLTLFVSTTFDSLLADAINEVRHYGEKRTRCLYYSTHSQLQDLPRGVSQLQEPHVYQIFGPLTSSTDYAVTEEDLLEFLHTLQSETRQPKVLFDELRDNHLLFLGCGFPDWLARFFIRTVTNERLLIPRETSEFVVDRYARQDLELTNFLQSYKAEVFLPGDPLKFVDLLYDRWMARSTPAPQVAEPNREGKMEVGAIFLSYASEDREAVKNMKAALDAAKLDVWYDERQLAAGDAWDREIRNNIRRCSLFLPFISRNSRQRVAGYFRKEWWWAIERAPEFSEDFPFIQPIVLDDTPNEAEGIPDYFWTRQCSRFPGGEPDPAFIDRARNAVRRLRAL